MDRQEGDKSALLHAFRRFLAWRRRQPALIQGRLEPLDLPEPLIGFIRELEGQRILALFNLSDSAVTTSVVPFGTLRAMPESGCPAKIHDDAVDLPPFSTYFAAMTPIGAASPVPVTAAEGRPSTTMLAV